MSLQSDGGIFGNLLGSVLSNPAALSSVIGALGGLLKQQDGDRDYDILGQAQNDEAHSELSSKLDEIIDRLDVGDEKGGAGAPPAENAGSGHAPNPPKEAETMSMLLRMLGSAGKKEKSAEEKHREALLCALKPYLAPERAAAVDKIIRLSELGNLFGRNLQGDVQQKHI